MRKGQELALPPRHSQRNAKKCEEILIHDLFQAKFATTDWQLTIPATVRTQSSRTSRLLA